MMTTTRTVRLAGVEVPRVGLGTNRLTNTPGNVAFLRAAVDAGLRHLDTARLYTGGESEETVGAALADGPEDLVVATKGGYGGAGQGRPEVLHAQVEQSLRALRVDAITLYYLHRVDPETPLEESLGAIKEHVDRGAIRHVGLSDVTVEQIERARRIVAIAAVQNRYHVGAQGQDAVIEHCAAQGIPFVAYYPLRGGDGTLSNAEKLGRLLRRSPVVAPIPGTLDIDHLRENLGALALSDG